MPEKCFTRPLFADGTMFFIKNKNAKRAAIQLQNQLNIAITFFHHWRFVINAFKTKGIFFSWSKTVYLPPLMIDNQTKNWSNRVNYLGITIECKHNFNQHINNITKTQPKTYEPFTPKVLKIFIDTTHCKNCRLLEPRS